MGKILKFDSIRILFIIVIFFNFNFLFVTNEKCFTNEGNILWVDDDFPYPEESIGTIEKPYKYISTAINKANNGDTIYVLEGTYNEDLIINKSINLISENVNSTFVDSNSRNAYLIDIIEDSVSLEGFTIRTETDSSYRRAIIHISENADNVIITDNIIRNVSNIFGIKVEGSDGLIIRNNSINDTKGIHICNSNNNNIYNNTLWNCTGSPIINLIESNSNIIENNTIMNCSQGIYAKNVISNEFKFNEIQRNDLNSIAIISGKNNIILKNKINNSNIGINSRSSLSNIIGNNISNCSVGIYLDSSNCIIKENQIRNSLTYGLHAALESYGNKIFDNNITSNSYYYLGKEDGNNQWDNGNIGNYWSDYNGPDDNGDGIGEITYIQGDVYDRYPKGIFNQLPMILNNSPSNLENGTSIRPKLSVRVIDPEGQRMDVYFYCILDNKSFLINTVYNVLNNSTACIPFYSTIEGKSAVYSYLGHGYDYICIWYVVVKDQYSSNKSSEWIFSTKKIPIDNNKPHVDIGGSYEGSIGDEIYFDGSGCYDSDGDIEFCRWNFGDGTSVSQTLYPKHVYENPGKYTVTLIIIDSGGRSNITTSSVTVSPILSPNIKPIADIGGPYSINTIGIITFDATNSKDDDGIITNYSWDFGDGSFGYGDLVVHNYTKNGTYEVVLSVTDNDGDINMVSVSVNVGDMASISSENDFFKMNNISILIISILLISLIIGILIWRFRMKN